MVCDNVSQSVFREIQHLKLCVCVCVYERETERESGSVLMALHSYLCMYLEVRAS